MCNRSHLKETYKPKNKRTFTVMEKKKNENENHHHIKHSICTMKAPVVRF